FLSCIAVAGTKRCQPCVSSVALGDAHACAVTVTGALWCWGSNNSGELGVASPSVSTTPVLVPAVARVRKVGAGGGHTCAIKEGGELVCWGANDEGQLGGGSTSVGGPDPVHVSSFNPFSDVSAGFSFTCAVTTDRRTLCWGKNDRGQLG